MISYVECLGGEGASPIGGGGAAARCWNGISDEDREELLPPKMAALQPKTEGSLRRRLLSAKLRQQQQDAILALNSGGGIVPSGADKKPPQQFCSPWFHRQPQEAHGKPVARNPVLTTRSRTRSCPPTPEPRPLYSLPAPRPSLYATEPPVREPEAPPQYRYRPSRGRGFLCFKRGRSYETDATQATPLLQQGAAKRRLGSGKGNVALETSKTGNRAFKIKSE